MTAKEGAPVPLNVMIPLGGLGTRFSNEGYDRPKPFVRVLGKEMILWIMENLEIGEEDNLVVVYNPEFHSMDVLMKEIVGRRFANAVFVELDGPTRGAAETVLRGLEGTPQNIRGRPVMLVDGDTVYTYDIVGAYREVLLRARKDGNAAMGASFVFHDTQPKPIYSYVKVAEEENNGKAMMKIQKIKEKVKISDWANSGCYCFGDGNLLAEYCAKIIAAGEVQLSQDMKGEFYTSGVIASMLDDGHGFVALEVNAAEDVHVLGTPAQVESFCKNIPRKIGGLARPYRFVFDLDNTLVTHPQIKGDYASCQPIERNIQYCKELKRQGHYIIVATARRMRTHHGCVGAVVSDIGKVTIDQLEKFGIPHDEVFFGKPWGHFYVDDANVDPIVGTLDKQLGFYFPTNEVLHGDPYALASSSGGGGKVSSSKGNSAGRSSVTAGNEDDASSSTRRRTLIVQSLIFAAGMALGAVVAKKRL
eukprot:CAMPEP_0172535034 /NCGR_PEP_ID=MMETSP1067-20121228/7205_1 /TAXON_ID=265564 ORGANISM="Thalassiosira punctigera, Strain Tpunct2005C2" /NCGR_SAMPLE_ID=MMETSP1067 /ASSEMBLY_ACC=CAM_ASM_000444 /LENGTH=474 /DNA_ID=CAMNT_0013319925 /DNA_START=125 /DNA_END=1549 /DNA_ORIENTATION=+